MATKLLFERIRFGVLITFERPDWLVKSLEALADQTRLLEHLIVVDNAPDSSNEEVVDRYRGIAARLITYLPQPENTGPAGAIHVGMEYAMERASQSSWLVLLDDDDPPDRADVLEMLDRWVASELNDNSDLGCVGLVGARYDPRRGITTPVRDVELSGPIDVDWVGGNQLPTYSIEALRAAGTAEPELFFGFDDLEMGLRLRHAGYRVGIDGEEQLARRNLRRASDPEKGRGRARLAPWRRYYSVRNAIYIQSLYGPVSGRYRLAGRAMVHSLYWLIVAPSYGFKIMKANSLAIVHGLRQRLGRRVEPGEWS